MLELKNITKCFGDFKALDDLSMTVPKGAVYGLVGPNGAGKTTLLRQLKTVLSPHGEKSGQILFDGDGEIVKMINGAIQESSAGFVSKFFIKSKIVNANLKMILANIAAEVK